MANQQRGEMTLAAGDQIYTLKLTANACCELEDASGKTFDQVILGVNRGSVKDLRWLIWAALQEHHSATVKAAADAGRVMEAAGGIAGVHAQIVAFMQLNADDSGETPSGGGKAANPPDAQARPTGDDSMSMPAASA